jgi:hypothetical protein
MMAVVSRLVCGTGADNQARCGGRALDGADVQVERLA